MSNYERNTSMVVCIFAVIIIGAIGVGALSFYGNSWFNWSTASTDFSFDAEVGATTGTVTLDINLATGGVAITFVDNATLLYDIEMRVQNTTLERDGAPSVTFTSNIIALDYTAAGVNITLGSGLNYTIDVDVSTGGVDVDLVAGAHVADISILTETGGIDFGMTDAVVLVGNATFDLEATTGGVKVIVDLPIGIGGSVECATGIGSVDITATGWTQITSNHYESSDYDTASQTLTVVIETSTGGIDAIFT
ncbi:MAG: LiaF domain-containing protein [Candidatus Thorarchaeota archaeon]